MKAPLPKETAGPLGTDEFPHIIACECDGRCAEGQCRLTLSIYHAGLEAGRKAAEQANIPNAKPAHNGDPGVSSLSSLSSLFSGTTTKTAVPSGIDQDKFEAMVRRAEEERALTIAKMAGRVLGS